MTMLGHLLISPKNNELMTTYLLKNLIGKGGKIYEDLLP